MSEVVPHILIAEDDKDSRFLIRRVIKKSAPSAVVSEASDGETALKIFLEKSADIVMVDHKIPIMSGLDLIAEIRRHNSAVPIILTSNDPAAGDAAAQSGINHFLNKAHLLRDLPVLLSISLKPAP